MNTVSGGETAPEVREAWPSVQLGEERLINAARSLIDSFNRQYHYCLVDLLRLAIGFCRVHPSHRGDWTLELKDRVLIELGNRCGELGVPSRVIELYYRPVFADLIDLISVVVKQVGRDPEALSYGLPVKNPLALHPFLPIAPSEVKRRHRVVVFWGPEWDSLLIILKERIGIVQSILLAKGPDAPILVPVREQKTLQEEQDICDYVQINQDFAKRYYIPAFEILMKWTVRIEEAAREDLETFLAFIDVEAAA